MNDMFLSVANGNLKGLENYLKNGGNVNLKDGNGTTLLHKV
jgi:ankyrin repeat protein